MKFSLRGSLALLAVVALLASCAMVAEGMYRVRLILERTGLSACEGRAARREIEARCRAQLSASTSPRARATHTCR